MQMDGEVQAQDPIIATSQALARRSRPNSRLYAKSMARSFHWCRPCSQTGTRRASWLR